MKVACRGCAALLILVLAGVLPSGAASLQEPAAVEAPPGDELAQLDAVLDLLIDKRYAEARDQAARLLEREDLPESVATWARKLREKAEERLKAAEGAPAEQTFPVRQALIGGGFAAGVSGSLRISAEGLAFTRKGRTKAEWSVPWQDLSAVRRDDGIWDVAEALVIVERGGRKHYLARIDGKGRYLSAGPILSAVEQGRKQRSTAEKVQKIKKEGSE